MLLDVRLWRVALSKEKIQQYMKEPPSESDPALIGWWPLDKGYGIDIEDKSPNQLHGEVTLFSYFYFPFFSSLFLAFDIKQTNKQTNSLDWFFLLHCSCVVLSGLIPIEILRVVTALSMKT
jgi:hypothetical protein